MARPTTPGYGFGADGDARLPWVWARERLEQSHNYWLSTAGEGGPHLAPLWGIWSGDAFLFSTGPRSKKARNFAADARVVVATERADEAVIVEGSLAVMPDGGFAAFLAAYNAKYAWDMTEAMAPFYIVTPHTVFGFIESPPEGFQRVATKWVFDEDAAG